MFLLMFFFLSVSSNYVQNDAIMAGQILARRGLEWGSVAVTSRNNEAETEKRRRSLNLAHIKGERLRSIKT